MQCQAQIGEKGRLVIPAEIRKAMGLEPGDTVVLELEENRLTVETRRARIKRAQERVRHLAPPGTLVSEELIAERRAEALLE